jgi:hypothetical protein
MPSRSAHRRKNRQITESAVGGGEGVRRGVFEKKCTGSNWKIANYKKKKKKKIKKKKNFHTKLRNLWYIKLSVQYPDQWVSQPLNSSRSQMRNLLRE